MSSTAPSSFYLPADDPHYRRFMAASQFEPSPVVRQLAATLVDTCPLEIRNDAEACAHHLQGITAAHGLTSLRGEGRRRAEPHLAAADEALDALTDSTDQLEAAVQQRQALPDEVVDAQPQRGSRADIRRQLSQNQWLAGQREMVGDREHLQPGKPHWWIGWPVAIIVAVIETVVTLRIFNVDLTHVSFSALPWLALTVGLVFFNHNVAAYLGEKRRIARETVDAATRLNTAAVHRMHRPGDIRSGAAQRPAGQLAGRAPAAATVRRARWARGIAMAIYGIPLILLMLGMYVRLFGSAERLELGLFKYVFPLIVVAVLAALLWALVVEPYSRGNALGDHLRSQQEVDRETDQRDVDLRDEGLAAAQAGRRHADAARSALMSVDEEFAEVAEQGHRAMQIASVVLGVDDLGAVRETNLTDQAFPHRDRIERAVGAELRRLEQAAEALERCQLPSHEIHDSPHMVYADPPSVLPDIAFVPPATMPSYPRTTLDGEGTEPDERPTGGHGRPLLAAALLAIVLVAGGIWWFVGGSSAAEASDQGIGAVPEPVAASTPTSVPATPAAPAGLQAGQDYSFERELADGSHARWGCDAPITVRLAGPAPTGAEAAVGQAVEAVRLASGLPLTTSAATSSAVLQQEDVPNGEILINYLSPEQLTAAGLDFSTDTLGQGGAMSLDSGAIVSGWVGIRTDDPTTDPTTETGQEVLWHELAHAVNLGHAAQQTAEPEIMAPVMDPTTSLTWGPGDSYALAAVGCEAA